MHTLISIALGVLALLVTTAAGRLWGFHSGPVVLAFLVFWCFAALVHGIVGIRHGETILTEIQLFAVVYGVPAATVVFLYLRK